MPTSSAPSTKLQDLDRYVHHRLYHLLPVMRGTRGHWQEQRFTAWLIRKAGGRTSTNREGTKHDLERHREKAVGEPDEGKPHVRFEVAGDGNQEPTPRRHPPTLPPDAGLGAVLLKTNRSARLTCETVRRRSLPAKLCAGKTVNGVALGIGSS